MTDLSTDAIDKATQALAERFDQECRGAWRAGYSYLHVYDPAVPSRQSSLTRRVYPSDRERPPVREVDGYRYTTTYVLDDQTMRSDRSV